MWVRKSAEGRFTHVLRHYLPMVALGVIFLVLAHTDPHAGRVPLGFLFGLLAAIMLVGALLGALFTHCPDDFVTYRVICYREPDVQPDPLGDYYRDLVHDQAVLP